MNDPANMMDLTSGEDVLGKEPADFGLKIKEDITPARENICDKTLDITSYDSPGDTFYNTVDVENLDSKKVVEISSSECENSDLDLINFDHSIRFSKYRHSTNNSEFDSDSPNHLNETFGAGGEIPITNKNLDVKTANLLRLSGICGRFGDLTLDSPPVSSNGCKSANEISNDEEDDYFSSTNSLKAEESGEDLSYVNTSISPKNKNSEKNLISDSLDNKESRDSSGSSNETLNRTALEVCTSINENNTLKLDEKNNNSVEQKFSESHNLTFESVPEKPQETVNNNYCVKQETVRNHDFSLQVINNPQENIITSTEQEAIVKTHNSTFESVPEKKSIADNSDKQETNIKTLNLTFEAADLSQDTKDKINKHLVSEVESKSSITTTSKETVITKHNSTFETVPEKSLEVTTRVNINSTQQNNIFNEVCSVQTEEKIDKFNNTREIKEKDLLHDTDIKETTITHNTEISPLKQTDITVSGDIEEVDITTETFDFELSPEKEHPNPIQQELLLNRDSCDFGETSGTATNPEVKTEAEKQAEESYIPENSIKEDLKEIRGAEDCNQHDIEDNIEPVDLDKTLSEKDFPISEMTDMMEKLNQQQAEISDLKLKLNAAQQHNASLELQIRQNEEIVIKTQAEALRTEQNYQQEVKQLKEKLNENSKIIEKDRIRELEEQVKESKAKETRLSAELSQKTKDDVNYKKIMDQYEKNIKARLAEIKKLQEENETTKTHLSNLEAAFSDVHLKYEKTKTSLQGVKANEEALIGDLEVAQATNIQHEERYESLKAYARTQIEKSNKEIHAMKEQHEMEISKLKAFIKRLEIKVSSLEVSLQQKTEECEQLSALCDEVTGKKV